MSGQRTHIDMGEFRSALMVARDALSAGDLDDVARALDRMWEQLNIERAWEVKHASIDPDSMREAIEAAAAVFDESAHAAMVLIVQTHDDQGRTTGRTLVGNVANPRDLLYVVMRNLERTDGT